MDSSATLAALEKKVAELEQSLAAHENWQEQEVKKCRDQLADLKRDVGSPEVGVVSGLAGEYFIRRAEWTIKDFGQKEKEMEKGQSLWSPKFKACGLEGFFLEFFPKGREKTTCEGFCSLFLWCPDGTKVKYQLWVGSFLRGPDEDEYTGRIGHGHSNFCPLRPEVDRSQDSVRVGVDFLEVKSLSEVVASNIRLTPMSLEDLTAREVLVIENMHVQRVVWKIRRVSEHVQQFPRGAAMWSQVFTAGGIREILLEFYPNGSLATTKDGFCAFYIRCPEGISMIVTLFVGKVRKGPIRTTFDSPTAKGLPEFCAIQDQVGEDDTLELGIELQNQPKKVCNIGL